MRLPCMPSSTAIASCSSHRACRWGPSAGSILSRLLLHSKQFSRAPLGLLCLLQWPLLQPAAPCFQPCFRRAKGRAGHHSCARDCSGCSVANLSLRGGCSWLLLCLLKSQASQQRGSARSGSDFPPIQACIPDPERAVFHELSMYIAKPCAEARGRRAPVKGALHSRQRSRRNRGLGPQWHHHWPQAHRLSVNRFHGPICAVIKPRCPRHPAGKLSAHHDAMRRQCCGRADGAHHSTCSHIFGDSMSYCGRCSTPHRMRIHAEAFQGSAFSPSLGPPSSVACKPLTPF